MVVTIHDHKRRFLHLNERIDQSITASATVETDEDERQIIVEYLAEHPEQASIFDRVMKQEILWTTPAILKAYDFSRFNRVVDVGGGLGVFLNLVLCAVPKLEGVLFDQPRVVAGAMDSFATCGTNRVTIVPGDFFESIPEGGDAYILRRIIHDWDDDEALKILSNIRSAVRPEGTLLILEGLIDSPTRPVGLMDLMMLVLGGRERTQAEFRELVRRAGFTLERILPAGAYSVMECCRDQ